jgi:hypothetical protein
MNDERNHDRERDARKRIATLIRAIGQGPKKPITSEEMQKLKAAADRLDHMLSAAADGDRQALRGAAARLDQLLVEIREGKDVTNHLKRRQKGQKSPP